MVSHQDQIELGKTTLFAFSDIQFACNAFPLMNMEQLGMLMDYSKPRGFTLRYSVELIKSKLEEKKWNESREEMRIKMYPGKIQVKPERKPFTIKDLKRAKEAFEKQAISNPYNEIEKVVETAYLYSFKDLFKNAK